MPPHAYGANAAAQSRHILTAFRKVGAVLPERAKTLDALGLKTALDGGIFSVDKAADEFKIFQDNHVIREVKAGEFYLDEDAYREYMATMEGRLGVLMALGVVVLIWWLFSYWARSFKLSGRTKG